MPSSYVERDHRGYHVAGSRVSLASLVRVFLDGFSPETIAAECFPTLTLEQVYGALAYYLAHRAEVDAHVRDLDALGEEAHRRSRDRNADLLSRLGRTREASPS